MSSRWNIFFSLSLSLSSNARITCHAGVVGFYSLHEPTESPGIPIYQFLSLFGSFSYGQAVTCCPTHRAGAQKITAPAKEEGELERELRAETFFINPLIGSSSGLRLINLESHPESARPAVSFDYASPLHYSSALINGIRGMRQAGLSDFKRE